MNELILKQFYNSKAKIVRTIRLNLNMTNY